MASIQHVIDLGIDANLGIESGTTYPLQQGLVKVLEGSTSGEGTPQWYTKFRQQDKLAFRLWDLVGDLQVASFVAYFLSPTNTTRLSSPLADGSPNPIVFSEKKFGFTTPGPAKSSVFTAPPKGWLLGANTMPLGEIFQLEKKGRYLLRIEVVVVSSALDRRTYILDPEMIVGSSDNPPDVDL